MMEKKLGAAAIILNDLDQVLLVKHSYGPLNWELPGGGAEAKESIVDTALREVREETGLQVIAQHLVGIYYEHETDMHHFVIRCTTSGSALTFQPNSEISDCAYWSPTDLPRPISDFTIQRIKDAVSGENQLLPVTIQPRQWLR